MLTTNTLVKGLLIVAYLALYGILAFLFRHVVPDPLFHAGFHIVFIAFVCLTYDLLYPYMLMGFKSSRGDLPASRLGSLAALVNALHEHGDLDSLLDFAGKALVRLMHVEKITIFVCDTILSETVAGAAAATTRGPAERADRSVSRGMQQWQPGLLDIESHDDGTVTNVSNPLLIRLEETNPLLLYARSQRTVFFASHCPVSVARELHRFDSEQALPAQGEQGLLCLLLPGGRLLQGGSLGDEEALLHFFCRQLNIAVERIDVQRRQQARKEAIYAEKMALLSNLSATIAHEMRTPLSGVRASITGVESYLPELLEGYRYASEQAPSRFAPIRTEHRDMLQGTPVRIKSMVDQANTVIDLLLVNLRNRELDRSNFIRCSIKACIQEALFTYPFKRDQRQGLHYSDGDDFDFIGVHTLMVYVLFNLIKNALYSIEAASKGEITIRLERTEHNHCLIFTDTGLGISAEVLPNIFDRFFTTKNDGTGAGLAFCKRTLQSFDGSIGVDSVQGEYTTFTLEFPLLTPTLAPTLKKV
ncbi:MAG: HAMP domain-containing sensor histidine kinase [Pseudomonadota bacterium]